MNSLQFILLACLALYAASEMVISRPLESAESEIVISRPLESVASEMVISRPLKSMISKRNVGITVIDPQNTFSRPDLRELPVPDADNIFVPISILMEFLEKNRINLIRVVSRDLHPRGHVSIATDERPPFTDFEYKLTLENGTTVSMTQTAWPSHAIAGTYGAEFDERFNSTGFKVFKKGTNSMIDSYSAFGDELGGLVEDTGLHSYFQEQNVNTVIVFGLATDYCVKYTIKDALRLGYKVILFLPGSAGITPEGVNSTIELVEKNGGLVIKNMFELYKIPTEIYENNKEYEFTRNN